MIDKSMFQRVRREIANKALLDGKAVIICTSAYTIDSGIEHFCGFRTGALKDRASVYKSDNTGILTIADAENVVAAKHYHDWRDGYGYHYYIVSPLAISEKF
jgi:hypothetical protein